MDQKRFSLYMQQRAYYRQVPCIIVIIVLIINVMAGVCLPTIDYKMPASIFGAQSNDQMCATAGGIVVDEVPPMRSIEGTVSNPSGGADPGVPANIIFGPSAFAGANNFFLGASGTLPSDAPTQAFCLSRANVAKTAGVWNVQLQPMAPASPGATINAQMGQASPFNNALISMLTIGPNNQPVVALTSAVDPKHVYLVTDPLAGATVLKNFSVDNVTTDFPLNTSAGAGNAATGIYAIAATKKPVEYNNVSKTANFIFAATSALVGAADFSQDSANNNQNSIVPIQVMGQQLLPLMASDFTMNGVNNQGFEISMISTDDLTTFKDSGMLLAGADLDMWWDDHLQRLFVGLSGMQSGANTGDGALGLLVGTIDTTANGAFVLKPSVTLPYPSALFPFTPKNDNNAAKYVIGGQCFKSAATVDLYKVRTMHTSTGKDYVVVVGGVANDGTAGMVSENTWVTAMPVMPAGSANAGMIADITTDPTDYAVVTADAQLTVVDRSKPIGSKNRQAKAVVGVDPTFISIDTSEPISDIQVVGDTVYVGVAGVRDATHDNEAGIFASSALFDSNGNVRAWTPWQREDGFTDQVTGFGFDKDSQNFWYLGDLTSTVTVTQWSAGDARLGGTSVHNGAPLSTALTSFTNNYGVYTLVSFDGATPGFAPPVNDYDSFTMMVATGLRKIALIQSGALDVAPKFVPTQMYVTNFPSALNDTVFVFDGSMPANTAAAALDNLGQITTVELSRITEVDQGWLFVGGQNGLAVLSRSSATIASPDQGKGFNGSVGLSMLIPSATAMPADFPGGSDWNFVQLFAPDGSNPFTNVRKIVADGNAEFLYILTRDALYRITMNAAGFTSTGTLASANNFVTMLNLNNGTIAGVPADPANPNQIPIGTYLATPANYNSTQRLTSLVRYFDQFFDMILLKSNRVVGKSSIALATSQGVIVSNTFQDAFTGPASATARKNLFFKVPKKASVPDNLVLGPTLRFEFQNALRGGNLAKAHARDVFTAEGNLYATALDAFATQVAVYRFNVEAGELTAIAEPYLDANNNPTDYFYKFGDISPSLVPYLSLNGPLDFVASIEDYGSDNNDFLSAIPVEPNPVLFLNAGQMNSAINLGWQFINSLDLGGIQVQDSASGAMYIPGQFGVLVNE